MILKGNILKDDFLERCLGQEVDCKKYLRIISLNRSSAFPTVKGQTGGEAERNSNKV